MTAEETTLWKALALERIRFLSATMNQMEITFARERLAQPLLGDAAQFLFEYMTIVNQNSDGWAHWAAGANAAEKLMDIVSRRAEVTAPAIKAAKAAIKRFCTRRNLPQPIDGMSAAAEPADAPSAALAFDFAA